LKLLESVELDDGKPPWNLARQVIAMQSDDGNASSAPRVPEGRPITIAISKSALLAIFDRRECRLQMRDCN
jgi:hypothetical protein